MLTPCLFQSSGFNGEDGLAQIVDDLEGRFDLGFGTGLHVRRSRLARDEQRQTEDGETRRDATLAFESSQALLERDDSITWTGC